MRLLLIEPSNRRASVIDRLLGVCHAGVLGALDRFAVPRNGNGRKRTGQLPFGFDYLNYQLVENGAEQAAIRMIRRERADGLSLRRMAGNLNKMLSCRQLRTCLS